MEYLKKIAILVFCGAVIAPVLKIFTDYMTDAGGPIATAPGITAWTLGFWQLLPFGVLLIIGGFILYFIGRWKAGGPPSA